MKLLEKQQPLFDNNDNIFEKKSDIQNLSSIKNIYDKMDNIITPFQLIKYQKGKRFHHFLKSSFERFDPNYKLKIMVRQSFSELIKHYKWDDINECMDSGYVLNYDEKRLIKLQISRKYHNNFFNIANEKKLNDILLRYAFVDLYFQRETKKTFDFLTENFPHEHFPISSINKENDDNSFCNNFKIKELGINREHVISAIHVHNSLINPLKSIPLFTCILHRAINFENYENSELEVSLIQTLSYLAKYIKPHLNNDDKLFIHQTISNKLKENFNNCNTDENLNRFLENFKNQFQIDSSEFSLEQHKEFVKNKIKKIYNKKQQESLHQNFIAYEHHIFSKLPSKFDIVVQSINELFIKIKNNSHFLESHQIDNINKLVNEIVPQSIEQYFDIEPKYRDSLKNIQGKNADDLLLESLNNIKNSLEPVSVLIEEKKLEKLSISNRKLAI